MRSVKRVSLELESGSPGSLGECGDSTVIPERTTIEADLFDTGGLGPFGDRLPHRLGGLLVATEADAVSERLVGSACRSQGPAGRVVDDLSVDVLVRTKDRQPRTLRGAANGAAYPKPSAFPLAKNAA